MHRPNQLPVHLDPEAKVRAVRPSSRTRDSLSCTPGKVLFSLSAFPDSGRLPGLINSSVVFIHGLGGGPEKTWTKELSSHPDPTRRMAMLWAGMTKRRKVREQTNVNVGRSVCWPRDLLPLKVADIRILTYGYDSKLINGRNQNGIYQHAENVLSALDRIRCDVRFPAAVTKWST